VKIKGNSIWRRFYGPLIAGLFGAFATAMVLLPPWWYTGESREFGYFLVFLRGLTIAPMGYTLRLLGITLYMDNILIIEPVLFNGVLAFLISIGVRSLFKRLTPVYRKAMKASSRP
jgi:hypothetical protein